MIVLGLTGSIGMGKTTVTGQFADAGAATTNADAIVHALLEKDEKVIAAIGEQFPEAIDDGKVSRQKLGAAVFNDDIAIRKLEHILHPRVRAAEVSFVLKSQKEGKELVVLDIPLLYESGADARCDAVVVVTAPEDVQRERVMSRPHMTEEKFRAILSRQLPDAEKRTRADFIIETHKGLEHSAEAVQTVIAALKKKKENDHA